MNTETETACCVVSDATTSLLNLGLDDHNIEGLQMYDTDDDAYAAAMLAFMG
jgi:hypothetical protein